MRACDAVALPALMEKAEAMTLSKRHPDVMATAGLLRDKLDGEAKVAATIQSAIRSKDRDALRSAMAKATEVTGGWHPAKHLSSVLLVGAACWCCLLVLLVGAACWGCMHSPPPSPIDCFRLCVLWFVCRRCSQCGCAAGWCSKSMESHLVLFCVFRID